MGSRGDFSSFFGEAYREFARENVDPLLEKGLKETDPVKRAEIYKELTKIAHDQAISLYLYQPGGNHIQRNWIKGWYYNPMIPGEPAGADFYSLTKGE
jgi:peptide/nickel transport system substrate-binding protein